MNGFGFRKLAVVAALVLALGSLAGPADARVGGGMSFGTRGSRTFVAPPVTRTAPTTASPIQRSITQPAAPNSLRSSPTSGFFGRGLFGGLAAGFLGAGLFGLLFGYGLFGGLGGFASVLGLLLQVGLVVLIGRFLWTMWQRREPAFAGGPMLRNIGSGFGAPGGGGTDGAPIQIGSADYNAFERLLGEIQTAYGNEDIAALRARVTPEMLSYFAEQLGGNASRGVVNQVSGVRLLQGDLAEAWREGATQYATVAMRFTLVDRTIDRASGRPVAGSESPQEVTELWTFMRVGGGGWVLSAIQQT